VAEQRPGPIAGLACIEVVPPSVLGQRLVDECMASVLARYPDCDPDAGDLPGPRDAYYMGPYAWEPYLAAEAGLPARRTPAEVLPPASTVVIAKQIAHYEYQSCEHEGWRDSEARAFCHALGDSLLRSLPGWEQAPWGIDTARAQGAPRGLSA
jgi:hypothetical protein